MNENQFKITYMITFQDYINDAIFFNTLETMNADGWRIEFPVGETNGFLVNDDLRLEFILKTDYFEGIKKYKLTLNTNEKIELSTEKKADEAVKTINNSLRKHTSMVSQKTKETVKKETIAFP